MKWRTLKQVEEHYIDLVMTAVGGCISAGARALGLHRRSLQRKLIKHGDRWRDGAGRGSAGLQRLIEQLGEEGFKTAAWLGAHIYWPVKERINWRLQPCRTRCVS